MTGAARPVDRRRPRRRAGETGRGPGIFVFAGWVVLAAVVAIGRLLDREADDDALPPATVVAEPAPEPVPEPVHEPVRVVAVPPAPPRPAPAPAPEKRPLPRPFAALHSFASPLLTPRLHLPRALVPRLVGLRSLLARARPGEPVAVTLSAYCLQGVTRRGQPVRPGIIAADPRVFPLARHVELFAGGRFLGRFLVDDTGKRIRGTRIDIWTPDCDDARRFGIRSGVATLVAVGQP